jgi:hypothetical protein
MFRVRALSINPFWRTYVVAFAAGAKVRPKARAAPESVDLRPKLNKTHSPILE